MDQPTKITPPTLPTIFERIEWARTQRGMSRHRLISNAIPSGRRSAYNYLEKANPQNSKYYVPIAAALNARVEWITTGLGEWEAPGGAIPKAGPAIIDESVLLSCFRVVENFITKHNLPNFSQDIERMAAVSRLYEQAMRLPPEDRSDDKLSDCLVQMFFQAYRS